MSTTRQFLLSFYLLALCHLLEFLVYLWSFFWFEVQFCQSALVVDSHSGSVVHSLLNVVCVDVFPKNGILIVQFANDLQQTGKTKLEAVLSAASIRLRPILMTSLATMFGALPIALALGAGASSRVPLGIVVVGGLLFALILTLFVIPVMYILMADKKLQHAVSTTTNNEIE